jgi:transcriptional regulator with XRE-family HTH domain
MPGQSAHSNPFPAAGLLRAARRKADFSQAEIANAAGIHPSTVGRIEAGERMPSLNVFDRLILATGHFLAVVHDNGNVLHPMQDRWDLRDGAQRRYPSHLDVIVDPVDQEWWGSIYGLARPPETYYRNRRVRDDQRRRSQWEVRVDKYRHDPPPKEARIMRPPAGAAHEDAAPGSL